MKKETVTSLPPPASVMPIKPAVYDRSAALTPHEEKAIRSIMGQRFPDLQKGPGRRLASDLARLLQPIQDMLSITKPQIQRVWTSIQSLMLREMGRRRRAFWGWSTEEWIETISPNCDTFLRTKSRGKDHRRHLIVVAYLLCGFTQFHRVGQVHHRALAHIIFGQAIIDREISRVAEVLKSWGYTEAKTSEDYLPHALCEALLINRSPRLEDLSYDFLEELRQSEITTPTHKNTLFFLSRALAYLGIIKHAFPSQSVAGRQPGDFGAFDEIPPEWVGWCTRWRQTTTIAATTATGYFYSLLAAGRWLAAHHPGKVSPAQWTREIAVDFVAAITRSMSLQWAPALAREKYKQLTGKPLSDRTKHSRLCALRAFFQDCQEWGWIQKRFDPRRALATPRSVKANIGPNPRVIADDIWAKLQWAGLNLKTGDLPVRPNGTALYPLEMVRAMAIVWLFCGLRSDEFKRLRCGCIRYMADGTSHRENDEGLPSLKACWLDVPTNKTGTAFTKPVDSAVGEAVQAWEARRPRQPASIDPKTGEIVQYLFSYRGHRIGSTYINETLIPLLCHKSGVPEEDRRGAITSHRARATITSQLYNAREPMTIFDLKEWLGHRNLSSTEHYVKTSPTKLTKAYEDAGYFERNRRMIGVLIDQEAIRQGLAGEGKPWKYYDLGHGYCTYDFFDQCPHRMACAKCSFYVPKESSAAQILEARSNLQRMQQEIPLREEERAAVEDGIEALNQLACKLADTPAPDGQTPRRLIQIMKRTSST